MTLKPHDPAATARYLAEPLRLIHPIGHAPDTTDRFTLDTIRLNALTRGEVAKVARGELTQCCGCMRLVPWLYLDSCESCLPATWTPEERAAYRTEYGLTAYDPDGPWRRPNPRRRVGRPRI